MKGDVLSGALESAFHALRADPDGVLALAYRQRIWAAMVPRLMNGNQAVQGTGLRRRTSLALSCVRRVLPFWEKAWPNDNGPGTLIELIENFFDNKVDRRVLYSEQLALWARVDNLAYERDVVELMVGCAACGAASTALVDEVFDPDNLELSASDEDRDAYQWDAAYYAAMVLAGGPPRNAESSIERRRQFWEWYLSEAVPRVITRATSERSRGKS